MKIKINEEAAKFLSEDERKYLILLEFYDDFVKEFDNIKKQFDEKKIYLFPDTLVPILQKYSIPIKFIYPLEEYIKFGEIFSAYQPIQIFSIRHQLNRSFLYYDKLLPPPSKFQDKLFWESWYEGNKHALLDKGITPALPVIQLNKRLSQRDLIKYITSKWEEIEEAIEDYEKSDPIPEQLIDIPIRDLEESMLIYRYKTRGLRYKEIDKKLRSGNPKIMLEVETIRKKYSDFNKILKKLGFVS